MKVAVVVFPCLRFNQPFVCYTASAIALRVGVKNFNVIGEAVYPDGIVWMGDRGEIEHENQKILCILALSQKGNKAFFIVTVVDPVKSLVAVVKLPKGWFALVKGVEFPDKACITVMRG